MCNRTEWVPIPQLLWDAHAVPGFDATSPEFGVNEDGEKCLNIDACLVPSLKALWAAGIVTEGCCCGHGSGGGVISIQTERTPGVDPRSTALFMRQSVFEMHIAQARAQALSDARDELQSTVLYGAGGEDQRWTHLYRRIAVDRVAKLLGRTLVPDEDDESAQERDRETGGEG
jgi:hypothetical protein